MTLQILEIDPERPRTRQLRPVLDAMKSNQAVVAYPGDSGYALICHPGQDKAVERMRQMRHLPRTHHLTLLCGSLKELGSWGQVATPCYRLMKRLVPGPYTFIVVAGDDAPRRILQTRKLSIGLRFPRSPLLHKLLELNGGPLLTTSLVLPGEEEPAEEPEDIIRALGGQLDFFLAAGSCASNPTTIVDLREGTPQILRQGAGKLDHLPGD